MPPPAIDAALPFMDDQNKPVQDAQGRLMVRPAGLDPHVFVNQGAADKRLYDMLLRYSYGGPEGAGGNGLAILQHEVSELSRFRQGGD